MNPGKPLADRPWGRAVDPSQPISIRFEGRSVRGFSGDVISSCLARNNILTMSRSMRYHRPRGIWSLGSQEVSTVVSLPRHPHVDADLELITEGMEVFSPRILGGIWDDLFERSTRLVSKIPRNKNQQGFFHSERVWRKLEPMVRRFSGLGILYRERPSEWRAPIQKYGWAPEIHEIVYDRMFRFYDIVVIGGGLAGMEVALAARIRFRGRTEARILIVEEAPVLGGAMNWCRCTVDSLRSWKQRQDRVSEVEQSQEIDVMCAATATGVYEGNRVSIVRRDRLIDVQAGHVILASGSLPVPLVFRGNDRPGVMAGCAVQKLLRLYDTPPGKRGVVALSDDAGYGVALDLMDANIEVSAVLDMRSTSHEEVKQGPLRKEWVRRGRSVFEGQAPWCSYGSRRIEAVQPAISGGDGEWRPAAGSAIDCDFLAVSVGGAPNVSLARHVGLAFDSSQSSAGPDVRNHTAVFRICGNAGGISDVEAVVDQAREVGSAFGSENFDDGSDGSEKRAVGPWNTAHGFPIVRNSRGGEFVDFDRDLSLRDIEETLNQPDSGDCETGKYDLPGPGINQGRHTNPNSMRIAASLSKNPVAEIGSLAIRPSCRSETFAVLAGRRFNPMRRTALHHLHTEWNAHFVSADEWLRPSYYGSGGRDREIEAEIMNVHNNVGIADVSTRSRVWIRGPDAAKFLDHLSGHNVGSLSVGRARYVVLKDESSRIIEDGVLIRPEEETFFLTSNTLGSEAVQTELARRKTIGGFDVNTTVATSAIGALVVSGPNSRQVLDSLCREIDLAQDAFPFLSVRTGYVAGALATVTRTGYFGELSFEINAPAMQLSGIWKAIVRDGRRHGIRPFGLEAQRVLRLEKGYVIVGQDTDSDTRLSEIGIRVSDALSLCGDQTGPSTGSGNSHGVQRMLVGFEWIDVRRPQPLPYQLVIRGGEITGRVTSVARSPVLDRVIGLAYVAPDQAEPGAVFHIRCDAKTLAPARVCRPPFYDPENTRQDLQ